MMRVFHNQKCTAMRIRDIFPSPSRLTSIISEILELEHRLSNPERESEYFQWALPNHRTRLYELKLLYQNYRIRYSDVSVDELLDHLHHYTDIQIRVIPSLQSRLIKSIAKSFLKEQVSEIKDILVMKSYIDCLPEYDQIADTFDVIRKGL